MSNIRSSLHSKGPTASGPIIIVIVAILMIASAVSLYLLSTRNENPEPRFPKPDVVPPPLPAASVPVNVLDTAPILELGSEPLPEGVSWTIAEIGQSALAIQVSTRDKTLRLRVPPALMLTVVRDEVTHTFYTASTDVKGVSPEAPARLNVVLLHEALTPTQPLEAPYPDVTLEPSPERLRCWLESCGSHRVSWITAQTGLWALVHDVTLEQWLPLAATFTVKDDAALARARRRAEQLLATCDAGDVSPLLFADLVEERRALLAAMGPEQSDGAIMRAIDTARVFEFAGDPAVTQRLIELMTTSEAPLIRRVALNHLVEMKMIGDQAALRALMLDAQAHLYVRFAAAHTLFQHGDPAAFPFLAALNHDAMLGRYIAGPLSIAIAKRSRTQPRPSESLAAFWERAMGWEKLELSPAMMAELRAAVEAVKEQQSPWLDLALDQLATATSPKERLEAAAEVVRFHEEPAAFHTIKTLTYDEDARMRMLALTGIGSFHTFDLESFFLERLDGSTPDVAEALLTIAAHHCGKYNTVIIAALEHPELAIRTQAMRAVAACRIEAQQERLLAIARDHESAEEQEAARQALAQMRSSHILPLLREELHSSDAGKRLAGFRQLARWGNNPAALELLAEFRNDPELGRMIEPHLRRHGYQPPPPPAPAE